MQAYRLRTTPRKARLIRLILFPKEIETRRLLADQLRVQAGRSILSCICDNGAQRGKRLSLKTPPDSILSDLTYDPGMGEFRWVVTPQGRASNLAGSKTAGGYTQICYKRVLYYAHRLAFLFMTGSMPEDQVDHANGDRSDNRWGNLRVCSKFENAQNARPPRHRTNSLPVGVKRNSKNRFWAEIMHKRVVYPLGNFRSPDEAHAAYLRAKASLHYFQPVPREGLHG